MLRPLLTTKLYTPAVRPGLVKRQRLVSRLSAGLNRKLTLISAPAGFGKTTLLSTWLHCLEGCPPSPLVAWLSLDAGDNDPVRFLAYTVAALQRVDESLGHGIDGALQSATPSAMEETIADLINQIDTLLTQRSRAPGIGDQPASEEYLVLVFDDYHVIETRSIHDSLAFFLEHLPGRMHICIASRTDPPLPVARLRGQGQVTEVRQADLSFTPSEAAELLNQAAGLVLSAKEIAVLSARTEGWIAGLQMASVALKLRQARSQTLDLPEPEPRPAHVPSRVPHTLEATARWAQPLLSGQNRDDVDGFIQAFAGSDRFVMDYLVEEVLQQQPESVQAFLLQTSILDRLTGSLCDATVTHHQLDGSRETLVKGQTSLLDLPFASLSGQEMLEHLERTNLFLVPLDDHREWYRYHHLFAELLRQRLTRVRPDLVRLLHCRASEWYAQHELTAQAIEHALSAGDCERAADLVERTAEETWKRSELATFNRWVDGLPREVVQARPMLGVYYAMGMLMAGRSMYEVEERLQDVAPCPRGMEANAVASVSGGVAAFRALVAAYQGMVETSIEHARQALDILPEERIFLRSMVLGILALAHLYGGDIQAATESLEVAAHAAKTAKNPLNAAMALCHLAELAILRGRLVEAETRFEEALEAATDDSGQPLPIAGLALIGLGQVFLEWSDLGAATNCLEKGIELTGRWGEPGAIRGHIALARVKQAQGSLGEAREHLQTAEEIAARFDAMELDDLEVAMHRARLSIAEGDLKAAERWVEERGLDGSRGQAEMDTEQDSVSYLQGYLRVSEQITLAELLIAQGQQQHLAADGARLLGEAAKLLKDLLKQAESTDHRWRTIKISILLSLAFEAQGEQSEALAHLERALSLAAPERYTQAFMDAGKPMERLLRRVQSRGITPSYAEQLLTLLRNGTKKLAPSPRSRQHGTESSHLSLCEPLSDREREVLGLLTTSLSSTEIADQLYISVNTVRSHIRSIYGKLDVHSRFEAVGRAQDLQLL